MYKIKKRTSRTIIIRTKPIKNFEDFENLLEALEWDDLYVEFLDNFYLVDARQDAFFHPVGNKENEKIWKIYNDAQLFELLKEGGFFIFKRVNKKIEKELKKEYKIVIIS